MTLSQLKKLKSQGHVYMYSDGSYDVMTKGKHLQKRFVPEGYKINEIGSYGPVDKPKEHFYLQEISKKNK